LTVPYEASQERRVNALGVFFSHGPQAGRFLSETYAAVPKSRAKKPRRTLCEIAAQHGLSEQEIGTLDAARLLAFIWKAAGRPLAAANGWRRERPLVIALDNYSVHKSQVIQEALPNLQAADVFLFWLPSYSPQLSEIEPIWNDVKHHRLTRRSYSLLGDLKRAADDALQRKADELLASYTRTEPLLQQAA
jgi:hypothetical protein